MDKKRILIVDNDDTILTLLRTLLDSYGYETLGALNGKTAIDILAREIGIDLIILDIMMPRVSGWQVMEFLKGHHNLNKIPVIMMTAKADDESVNKGLYNEQVSDYIIKPFEMDDFIDRVESVVH